MQGCHVPMWWERGAERNLACDELDCLMKTHSYEVLFCVTEGTGTVCLPSLLRLEGVQGREWPLPALKFVWSFGGGTKGRGQTRCGVHLLAVFCSINGRHG